MSDVLGCLIKVVDLKPHGRTLPVTNENKHEPWPWTLFPTGS